MTICRRCLGPGHEYARGCVAGRGGPGDPGRAAGRCVRRRLYQHPTQLAIGGDGLVPASKQAGRGTLSVIVGPWGSGKTYVLVHGYLLPTVALAVRWLSTLR